MDRKFLLEDIAGIPTDTSESDAHQDHSVDHNLYTTAQQVAIFSRRLVTSARNDASAQSANKTYADDALKTILIKGRRISPFAPFRHQFSAFRIITPGQLLIVCTLVLACVLGVVRWGMNIPIAVLATLMLFYLGDLLFTFLLSTQTLSQSSGSQIKDAVIHGLVGVEWPRYTILCPLYREVEVVPQFVKAMQDLDYPPDKLQILFLTEEDDSETRTALTQMNLPSHFSIVTVPEGEPRTKPRACNYGLLQADGDYIVIYDAEDIPDPLQLKKAVLTFASAGPEVACVQAKLNFYNPRQNLLTRWFTAEYSLWFDSTLPGLQRAGLPLPLGGTSNHFRAETLRTLGAWDPFNVTEDCDLGLRLAHHQMKTAMLDSTTYEEANPQVKNWLRQRSRWIKGYMQTYLVYMRRPWRYLRPGRLREFLALQLIIGGKTAVLFINPLMWLLLISYFCFRPFIGNLYHTLFPRTVLYMGSICLVFGNFFYVYSHIIGCLKRKRYDLVRSTLLIPFYWALTSIAGFIAFFQLIFKPHYWEKTKHGLHLQTDIPASTPQLGQQEEKNDLALMAAPTTKLDKVTPTLDAQSMSPISTGAEAVEKRKASNPVQSRSLALCLWPRSRRQHRPDPWLLAVLLLSCIASITALIYFFQTDQILTYGDSYSHLLIARRIIDSATPGLAQIGGVWLPLPHILMLPFIWNDYLWKTGLAGSFVAMPCYVIAALYLFLAARRLTRDNRASFVGTLLFVLNPNVLYLQVTPLSEIVLVASMLMACYHFIAWTQDDNDLQLILAALGACLATMSRYDGWFLFLAFLCLVPLIGWLKRQGWSWIEGKLLTFASLGGLGIVLWILWCAVIFANPLYWQNGPFSSQAQQQSLIQRHILYTYHNMWQSVRYFTLDSVANVGLITFVLGALGLVVYLCRRRVSPELLAGLVFVVPFVFYMVSLYDGQAALYVTAAVPASAPNGLYNARYGAQSVAPAAFFAAILLARLLAFLSMSTGSGGARRWFRGWTLPRLALPAFFNGRMPRWTSVGRVLALGVFTALIVGQAIWTATDGIVSLQDGLYGLDCAPRHESFIYIAQHYDGGHLLVDTFTSSVPDIPFKNVIYEGSGNLWNRTLKAPASHVEWILADPTNSSDLVAQAINVKSQAFLADYQLVVKEPKGLMLFHRKGLPPLPTHKVPANLLNEHALCGSGDPNHK